MKIIEVIADKQYQDTIKVIAEHHQIDDVWFGAENEDGRIDARLLVTTENRQLVLDELQEALQTSSGARIIILPVETVLSSDKNTKEQNKTNKGSSIISREEIFSHVEKGAQLNQNFFVLVVLSSIVAGIGLLENNIAVIIGAMVIAPLLGPNIAFSLGSSLGETRLMWQSLKAIASGIILAIVVATIIGLIWPLPIETQEVLIRTEANYAGTAIALASGAAAALSLVTGTSGVLVGVMVAVALMPPAVTIGLMLSIGNLPLALGAALLLAVNIVCINLSAKLVFLIKGIQPRTWLEARTAKQSQKIYLLIWVVLLILLVAVIYFRHKTL
ncbi:MAG: TIGR00341 family protein [Gammaproteobacteria bacterium]|nr:TIGR00341 family protein [Gammaproteobacteria bacterium]